MRQDLETERGSAETRRSAGERLVLYRSTLMCQDAGWRGASPASIDGRRSSHEAASREVPLKGKSIHDRLARVVFLCAEAHTADRRKKIPTERLAEVLVEAEQLCRVLRKALKKNESGHPRKASGILSRR